MLPELGPRANDPAGARANVAGSRHLVCPRVGVELMWFLCGARYTARLNGSLLGATKESV